MCGLRWTGARFHLPSCPMITHTLTFKWLTAYSRLPVVVVSRQLPATRTTKISPRPVYYPSRRRATWCNCWCQVLADNGGHTGREGWRKGRRPGSSLCPACKRGEEEGGMVERKASRHRLCPGTHLGQRQFQLGLWSPNTQAQQPPETVG